MSETKFKTHQTIEKSKRHFNMRVIYIILSLVAFFAPHEFFAQITISTSATSGVTINTTGNPYTVTGAGNLNNGQLEGYLNSGHSVFIDATGLQNLTLSADINKTSGGDVTLTLRAGLDLYIGYDITSTLGELNLVLWSGWNTNSTRGWTKVEYSTVTTNGGHLWIGGGASNDGTPTTTWNGLTVGTSYATDFGSGTNLIGLGFYQSNITTSGGDAWLAGRSAIPSGLGSSSYYEQGIRFNQTNINTGSGALTFKGLINAETKAALSAAVYFGNNYTIQGTGAGDLTIIGESSGTGTTDNDISLENGGVTINWGTGNVIIKASQVEESVNGTNDITISNAGSFTFEPSTNSTSWDAGTYGTDFGIYGSVSSGTFTGSSNNDVSFLKIDNIASTSITIGKSSCTSGVQVFSGLTNVGALTLNSSNYCTVNSATSVTSAGQISINGGGVYIQGDITSTATTGTGISLNGTVISQSAGVSALTSGADINYLVANSPWTSGENYAIGLNGTNGNEAIINAQGGDITITSSFASSGSNNSSSSNVDEAINLVEAEIKTSGTGSITINGDAYNNASTTANVVWGTDLRSGTIIQTDSGDISITGKGGQSFNNSRGIISNNTNLQVISTSGTISFTDLTPVGNESNYTGMYFRPSSSNSIKIGADGSLVTSSSSDIVFNSDEITFDIQPTSINTSGTVILTPNGDDFTAAIATTYFAAASTITGLTIGKSATSADGTTDADVTLSSATSIAGPITIHCGAMAINADLTATSSQVTLNASGAVTQSSGSAITASSLAIQSTGTFTLTEATNDIDLFAAGTSSSKPSNISLVDADGFQVGTVGSLSGITNTGTVTLKSVGGDITLAGDITTTSTSTSAVVVMSDYDAVSSDAGNGSIIISGSPTISGGTGSIIKLYSGAPSSSTGLTNFVGTPNCRYMVDQNTSTFSPTLSANNKYALYRVVGNNNAGNALTFDGVNDNVSGSLIGGGTGSVLTIEYWVNFNSLTNQQNMMNINNGGMSDRRIVPYKTSTNRIALYTHDGINNTLNGIISDYTITANQWVHLAFVNNNGSVFIYANGNLVGSGSSRAFSFDNTDEFWLGSDAQSGFISNIKMDEVRIWNDVRTSSEIQENMCRPLADPSSETNLVAYYQFDAVSGTSLSDSKNSNTGTLNNMSGNEWTTSTAYNTWLGNTSSWSTASNWSLGSAPVSSDNVGIYSGTSNAPALGTSATAAILCIGSSASLSVPAQANLTVSNSFVNEGSLTLNASSSGYSQLKLGGSTSGSGTVKQYQYISSAGHHGIASSMSNGFTTTDGTASSLYSYDASTGAYDMSPTTTGIGTGFFAPVQSSGFISSAGAFYVSGSPNISHTHTLGYSSTVATGGSGAGWNFIGNPYSCGLDWSSVTKNNVNNAIYIWDATTSKYNYYVNGVTAPSGTYAGTALSSQIIAPMQAFWVQVASNAAASIVSTMANDGDVSTSPTFYKNNPDNIILTCTENQNSQKADALWIKNVKGTTASFEGNEDAWKMRNYGGQPEIYTYNAGDWLAVNAIDVSVVRVVSMGMNAPENGVDYSISMEQVTAENNYQVILEDKSDNSFHDLSRCAYSFTYIDWTNSGTRFNLHFTTSTIGVGEKMNPAEFLIYQRNEELLIFGQDSDNQNYQLVNMAGQVIASGQLSQGKARIYAPTPGIYIFRVEGIAGASQKVVIQ